MRKMKRLRLFLLIIPLIAGLSPLSNYSQGTLFAQSEDLSTTVKETLKNDEILAEFSIVPLVVDGVVTLYGAVDTQEQLARLTEIVLGISGVKSAVNKAVALDNAKEENGNVDEENENNIDQQEQEAEAPQTAEVVEQDITSANIPDGVPEFHIAKPGESLQDISDRYGVAAYLIRQLNGMGAAQQPVAFQKIILGGSAENNIPQTEGDVSNTVVLEVLGDGEETLEVQPERTYEEPTEPIVEMERELEPQTTLEEAPREATTEVRKKPSRAEQQKMRANERLVEAETIIRNGWVFHRVSRNDNDAQIADYYNVSLADLRKKNGLRPGGALRRGSLIRIKKADE